MSLNGFRRIALAQGLLPAAARTEMEEGECVSAAPARQASACMDGGAERAVQAAQIRSAPAPR